MTNTLTLEPFEATHLDAALGLSQAVGWPHRAEDWAMLLEMGRGLVAFDQDKVIGTALGARFGPELSVAFMIIVDAAYQGRGIGRKLMEAVLPDTGCCRLVATAEGRPLYEKLGFEAIGQIRQLQGHLNTVPEVTAGRMRKAGPEDLSQITALETAGFGGDRAKLMHLLSQNGTVFVTEDAAGQITGFTARRAFGRGQVIGPICAPDTQTAQALIAAAMQGQAGRFLRIDTDVAAGLVPWIETLGLAPAGSGLAMQRGAGVAPAPRYALFSQALG